MKKRVLRRHPAPGKWLRPLQSRFALFLSDRHLADSSIVVRSFSWSLPHAKKLAAPLNLYQRDDCKDTLIKVLSFYRTSPQVLVGLVSLNNKYGKQDMKKLAHLLALASR